MAEARTNVNRVAMVDNAVLAIIFEHVGRICSKTAAFSIPSVCRRWRSVCFEMTPLPHIHLKFKRKEDAQRLIDIWLETGHFRVSHGARRFPFERFRKVRSASIEGHSITEAMFPRSPTEGGSVLTTSELYQLNTDPAARDVEKWIARCIKRLTDPARGLTSLALITHSQCHVRNLAGRCRGLTSLKLRCGAVMQMGAEYERSENEHVRAFERQVAVEDAATNKPSVPFQHKDDLYDGMTLREAFAENTSYYGEDAYNEEEDPVREHVDTGGGALDDFSLRAVLEGCSQLTCLDLSTPEQWRRESKADAWDVASIRQVEWLNTANGCGDGITGAGIQGCPNLVELNLIGCRNISDEGLQVISSGCPKLRCLRIGGSTVAEGEDCAITDVGMLSLATLTVLEELCVFASGSMHHSNISAAAFAAVLQGCEALRTLLVLDSDTNREYEEYHISVPVFAALQPIAGRVTVVPNLTTLIIDTPEVLPANLSPLSFSGCPSLTVFRCALDITTGVGAASCGALLSVLASNCHGIKVIAVARTDAEHTFHDNNSITDTVLSLLAAGCRRLEELAVEEDGWNPSSGACCPVTDSGLLALVSACKNLKILKLPSTDKVTDFGMYHVSQKATGLNVLRACSTSITMAGVCLVLQACCKLEKFQVTTSGFANSDDSKWREAVEAKYSRVLDLQ